MQAMADVAARFKDTVEAINFLEEHTIVTGIEGEAWDIVKAHLLAKRMCETHDWSAAEIGALMIAATQAIDTVESMWSSENNGPMPADLSANVAAWRAAVAREGDDA